MKIVVAIKQVLDPLGFTVNRKAEKIFVNREEYVINPPTSAQWKRLCRSRTRSEPRSSFCVAAQIARTKHCARRGRWGRSGHSSSRTSCLAGADGLVAARLLAAAVRKLGQVDLALTGERSLDTGAGEVGPRLAEALGWPHVLAAHKVELADGKVLVIAAEGRKFIALEAPRPVVVAVAEGANEPRYANAARVIDSYQSGTPKPGTPPTWA